MDPIADHPVQAAEFLVFCADLRRVYAACRQSDLGALEGWTEHSLAAVVDTALMAQGCLVAAESLGLGGVFIGGLRNDPETVVEQLALPELVAPLFGLCLGWPAEDPQVKPRLPLALILHQDSYRDPDPAAMADYDRVIADYYAARDRNARAGDWTATTARAMQGKKRAYLLLSAAAGVLSTMIFALIRLPSVNLATATNRCIAGEDDES